MAAWLTPRELRPAVVALYDFARIADDIADDPRMPAADKIARLDAIGAALDGRPALAPPGVAPALDAARTLRRHLDAHGVALHHAHDLLYAFAADATLTRLPDWGALMASCRLSAAPIGRIVLGFHGEDAADPAVAAPSDALCAALQVLNHVQDCREDYLHCDRIYVPADWREELGAPDAAFGEAAATAPVRAVLNRCLAGVDRLLAEAAPLALRVARPRLAAEIGAVAALAWRLAGRLRRRDPLAERVALGRAARAGAVLGGALSTLARRAAPRRGTVQRG